MGLPKPSYSFTIPSLHDSARLDCRIYHPDISDTFQDAAPALRRGVVVAHPYAPLGGCYDDPVVHAAGSEFLRQGFVLGTFNFRGASSSKGRTSWSGKAEIVDYGSFVGLLVQYLSRLPISKPDQAGSKEARLQLVLGGYSYGSLVASNLPPVESILENFKDPLEGSAAAEILLRAESLASQQKQEILRQQITRETSQPHCTVMGGEESSPESSQKARDTRLSLEFLHNLELPRSLHSLRKKSHEPLHDDHSPRKSLDGKLHQAIPDISTSYFLISPLMPPVSLALIPTTAFSSWRKKDEVICQLGLKPTLAIFGDSDTFSAVKKLRDWAELLHRENGERFQYAEITGAGHFWREHDAEPQMRKGLRDWIARLELS